ncbi:MAG: aminoacetone oxidase family FAD-binding enzyme, partial [Planctomycetota bacterium]
GGRSYPELGGRGSGYGLARAAGHGIVAQTPALVPLVTREQWPHALAGVSLPEVRVWIDLAGLRKRDVRGELLFTHQGVSGPAALDISGDVAALLKAHGGDLDEAPLRVEVVRGMRRSAWEAEVERWRSSDGGRTVAALLGRRIPRALAHALSRLASEGGPDLGDAPASSVTREGRRRLAGVLSELPLMVRGTEGFGRAMVTRGGVDLGGVDPRTLGSRKVRGLFFAGEVLDLAGPCGGHNLQWAFSSGRLAGVSAAGFAAD